MENNNNIFKKLADREGIKIGELERLIGASKGVLSRHVNNGTDIQLKWLLALVEKYPQYDLDWLINNSGAPIRSESCNSDRNMIPLFDVLAIGGTRSQADMAPTSYPADYIDAGDWFREATAAMRIYDVSMEPVYRSGDTVALKDISDKTMVIPGKDYVIETEEYRVLKRIQFTSNPTEWLACSYNMDKYEDSEGGLHLVHQPFPIKIDSVKRVLKVLGSVRWNNSNNIINKQ